MSDDKSKNTVIVLGSDYGDDSRRTRERDAFRTAAGIMPPAIVVAMIEAHRELRCRGVEAPIRFCITEAQMADLKAANAVRVDLQGPTFRGAPVEVHDFGGYAFCTATGLRAEVKP